MTEAPTLYDIREDETRLATQADLDALMNKAATKEIRKRLLGRILYMDAAELTAEHARIVAASPPSLGEYEVRNERRKSFMRPPRDATDIQTNGDAH